MKKQITLTALATIALVTAFVVVGCSTDETKNESKHLIADVIDSVTEVVSEEIANVVVDELDLSNTIENANDTSPTDNLQSFTDLLIRNQKVYTVGDNNLFVYDIKNKKQFKHSVSENLHTVVWHNGSIYVGGESLYMLSDTSLEFVDDQYDGTITELYSYGSLLMIGTTEGLYSRGVFGKEKLMDEITVSAITEDNSGLWIGSLGEGLYRWDGEIFKKRFLRRDTTIFDYVNAIDFKHGHLYLGCDNGMYIYDGGKWTTLTIDDGLPANNIRAIDATDWTVYVATDKGVVGYFENELTPVNKLENKQVNAIKVRGRKLVVATEYEGIIEKNGNSLKTLIQPISLENLEILSLVLKSGC